LIEFLNNFLILLEKIPATFWGVVVGSFFSILGVFLTNRNSEKRLKIQFNHEISLKTKEREMQLKKEVYLEVSEAIACGVNTIHTFNNLEINNHDITKEYSSRSPCFAKVHIIGKSNTVKAISDFTINLSVYYIELFSTRNELLIERSKVKNLDLVLEQFCKDRDSILEMFKQFNIEGSSDKRKWEALEKNYKFLVEQISNNSNERDKLGSELYIKQMELGKVCVDYEAKVFNLVVPIILSIRNELELTNNDEFYKDLIELAKMSQKEALSKFIENLKVPNTEEIVPASEKRS
jgi:hypothetical protein